MGNVRPLNYSKYGISKNRFWELYFWCLQYGEWREELKYKTDTVKSVRIASMPSSHSPVDVTQQLAIRRVMLEQNCKLIEQTAIETDADIYKYIMKAVTEEDITYEYLRMIMEIPCSHNTYYDRRRKFYWLLDKRKN
ncbi:hypothetical protein [Lacrimispora xylanisolvens]|uniref:hypothetical protein n=1 Tax=Lacrimispora xylanisolvens TaxID=384636 RepID=UPI0024029C38